MMILIRELRIAADGTQEVTDKEFSGERVTLGAAPDQVIQLIGSGIASEHAVITSSAHGIKLTCNDGLQIIVNKSAVSNITLNRGDTLTLGAHRLRLINAPVGFDIAIEVQLSDKVDSSEFEGAFVTELKQTGLNKRRIAWISSIVILGVFLVIPLLFIGVRHFVRLPDALHADRFWSPGPLAAAHQHAIGDDCSTCHKVLFQRVRDQACISCHVATTDHVAPEHLALTSLGDKPRCATCHREHMEPMPHLIMADNGGCKDCHARSTRAFGSLKMQEVDGFSSKDHPEFTLHLLQATPVKGANVPPNVFAWNQVAVTAGSVTEDSHLKFPHDVHLDPAHVTRMNDGKPLSCMDCHALNTDGEHFASITMQNACVSCHDLAFDPTNPARQLPHGKPREVIQMLQEYYAAKYLDPAAARAVMTTVERRRIPGREDEEAGCDAPPMVCARRETARQIDIQFNVRGCVTCHQVVDTQSNDIVERYQVLPVRLSADYYPAARFPHNRHLIQGMLSGDDACASCHGARGAKESTVVMIPGIDHCLSCHSSRSADRKPGSGSDLTADSSGNSSKESNRIKVEGHGGNIKLGCVECHRYHPGKRQAAVTPTNMPITSAN